jgi:hypothetical protein
MSYFKNLTHRDYAHFKAKYNNTVPIRGRSEDVRPIGERRRTHELITTKKYPCGQVSYCATLYGTDVVEYHNNGQVTLRTGGWATPSTADFMHEHSPFTVWKQDNKLWVRVTTPEGVKAFPVGEELTIELVDGGPYYQPINKVLINKRVVDRAKAKAAREPLQPFLAWCKSFLAMSDGWVMHETRKAALGWEKHHHNDSMFMPLETHSDFRLLTEPQMEIEVEDTYLRVLCSAAPRLSHDERTAETINFEMEWGGNRRPYTREYKDYRIEFDAVKRKAYASVTDIHTITQVEPGHKAMNNTV